MREIIVEMDKKAGRLIPRYNTDFKYLDNILKKSDNYTTISFFKVMDFVTSALTRPIKDNSCKIVGRQFQLSFDFSDDKVLFKFIKE